MRAVDLTGQRFGRLTVVRYYDTVYDRSRSPKRLWLCLCDCGTETIVRQTNLKCGFTKSCGCLRSEVSRRRAMSGEIQRKAAEARSRKAAEKKEVKKIGQL